MTKTIWIFIAVFGIGLVAVSLVFFGAQEQSIQTSKNDLENLAAIELRDFDEQTVSLGAYEGKPLVVNAWAVWCPFCKQELPDFAALQQEFPDISVIAIDRAESPSAVHSYIDGLGIADKMTYLLDPDDAFYRAIGGFSMPETVFLDTGGAIVFHKRGPMTLEEMRAAVNQYLK